MSVSSKRDKKIKKKLGKLVRAFTNNNDVMLINGYSINLSTDPAYNGAFVLDIKCHFIDKTIS